MDSAGIGRSSEGCRFVPTPTPTTAPVGALLELVSTLAAIVAEPGNAITCANGEVEVARDERASRRSLGAKAVAADLAGAVLARAPLSASSVALSA
jgi:hypothetical protein